jgi:hypothetical protein
MTKTKIALAAAAMLAMTPVAYAEEAQSIPPNSAAYGYVGSVQELRPMWNGGYDAQARALESVGSVETRGAFTAQEQALFDRASKEIF